MPASRDQIDALLRTELGRPEVAYARSRLERLLHEPRWCLLEWQYTDDGPFEAWVVGRSDDGTVELVWCDGGLGAGSSPWGAVIVQEGHQGIDAQWHSSLMGAAICLGLIPAPDRYEVQ